MTHSIDQALRENLATVQDRIHAALSRSGRPAEGARLVAVTKTCSLGIIRRLIRFEVRVLGENRVQDAAPKISALGSSTHAVPPDESSPPSLPTDPLLEWHLIGHLQSNKVRRAVELFDWIHSVHDDDLLRRIDRVAAELRRRPQVLLQVNVSGEKSKHGADPARFEALLTAVADVKHCDVVGLMTMAPLGSDAQAARPHFAALRELRDRYRSALGPRCTELSMGMSNDFEAAIEEGATLVRVGSALFSGIDAGSDPGE